MYVEVISLYGIEVGVAMNDGMRRCDEGEVPRNLEFTRANDNQRESTRRCLIVRGSQGGTVGKMSRRSGVSLER